MNKATKIHWATKAAIQIAGRRTHAEWSSRNTGVGIKNAENAVRSGIAKIFSGAIKIITHT